MNKKEPENCWKFWNCNTKVRKDCPAYSSDFGKECWMVAGHYVTKLKQCPRVKQEFETCFECPWFKKFNN